MGVVENAAYLIRERLPNILDATKIQKHFGKLFKPRQHPLGL